MVNFRVGIIGCGTIAAAHADAYRENGAQLVAVADSDEAAAAKFAEAHSVEAVYSDYLELLEADKVQAISVCTPPSLHRDIAIAALQRGIHVLCEKPLADTEVAGQSMAKAAQASDALLMVAFRHRFLPSVKKIKELIELGKIGRPVTLHNSFCGRAFHFKDRWFSKKAISGGGCMLDSSSHTVDIFRFLFGEIVEQHCVMNRAFEGTDVEDSSILIVRSESGVLGTFFASWGVWSGRAVLDVMGDKGRLYYEYGSDIILTNNDGEIKIPVTKSGGFREEIAHFIDAILKDNPLECSWEDGLRSLNVIQSLYK